MVHYILDQSNERTRLLNEYSAANIPEPEQIFNFEILVCCCYGGRPKIDIKKIQKSELQNGMAP